MSSGRPVNPVALVIELLGRAIAYEQDAFEDGEHVDGGDLNQFFAEWRTEAERVLSLYMRFRSAQLASLIDLRALVSEALGKHEADGLPDGPNGAALLAWCTRAEAAVEVSGEFVGQLDVRLMDTEEFNQLLNGPLHHPMVPFVITRLSLALSAVVAGSPAAAAILRSHCQSIEEQDRRKGGDH